MSEGKQLINKRAAELSEEVWWEEHFEIGATGFTGKIKPDRGSGAAIVTAVLSRAGFAELCDAAREALHALRGADGPHNDAIEQLEAALAKARGGQ